MKAGTTKAPLLVMKCAAGIVASPQGRGNRRSVGTPWNASVQGRTAWKPSFQFRSWTARFHPGQGTRGGTRPSKAGRRLRGREAFGVHQLAGAVEDPYCAGRPATPLPPSTNDRIGCSPNDIAQWRAGFHPGPMVTIRLEGPVPPGPRDAVGRIPPCPSGASEVAKRMEGAALPALSDSDTPPGDLPPHRYVPGPCYARPYGWLPR